MSPPAGVGGLCDSACVIRNPHRHIYAEFNRSSEADSFPGSYVPVIGWSNDGDALVAHPETARLAPAAEFPNFDRLSWDDLAIQAAFTAPPGYTVADLDGTPLPVVGFAVVPGNGVHPFFVGKGGDVLLETDDVVITVPPSAEHEVDSQRLSAPSE